MQSHFNKWIRKLSGLQMASIRMLRISIAIVLIWIGSLKYFNYESEGISAYVANSPLMSFFYENPREYKSHELKEGQYTDENFQWHEKNHTHLFGLGLGIVIITIGLFLLLNKYNPWLGMVGAFLVVMMSVTTLSFLVTTPEAWVPDLGDPNHGFPLLAAKGRLVLKDIIMLAGGIVALCDSATGGLAKSIVKHSAGSE